jgi:hypothetical protein
MGSGDAMSDLMSLYHPIPMHPLPMYYENFFNVITSGGLYLMRHKLIVSESTTKSFDSNLIPTGLQEHHAVHWPFRDAQNSSILNLKKNGDETESL